MGSSSSSLLKGLHARSGFGCRGSERFFGRATSSESNVGRTVKYERPFNDRHTLCYVDGKTDTMTWPNWRMWMAAAGVDNNFDDSRCVGFADSSYVVQAVVEGGAVGLADLDMIAGDLAQGRLVRLFDVGVRIAAPYAYHLVYPQGSEEDARVVAFRDWLLGEAGAPTA